MSRVDSAAFGVIQYLSQRHLEDIHQRQVDSSSITIHDTRMPPKSSKSAQKSENIRSADVESEFQDYNVGLAKRSCLHLLTCLAMPIIYSLDNDSLTYLPLERFQ